jgi:8-amino-7-oxononanoate synthase
MTDEEKRARVKALLQRRTPTNAAPSTPATTRREGTGLHDLPGVQELAARKAALAARQLPNPYFTPHEGAAGARSTIGGREVVNFSSYNYLGWCGDHRVSAAAAAAIERYGTSASASRIASGERPLHRDLEQALAAHYGTEDCVVFVSGHATNVTVIGHLLEPGDLILHDALIHNSALLGAQLSGARRLPFPHNDWAALDRLLTAHRAAHHRVLIIVEGVYSMDGDVPDLPQFIAVKQKHDALLMVDEAHALGVLGVHGGGIGEHCAVQPTDVDLWMGTLSKTLASCGGYICASHLVVEYLKYTAPGFLYSVGLAPPLAAAALCALQLTHENPGRVQRLRERAEALRTQFRAAGWKVGASEHSAVVPLILGDPDRALQLAHALFTAGINVQPILPPAVEVDQARLRFFLSALHTPDDISQTVRTVGAQLERSH